MDAWMHGCINDWMDGMVGWVNQCIDGWTDQLMDRSIDGQS